MRTQLPIPGFMQFIFDEIADILGLSAQGAAVAGATLGVFLIVLAGMLLLLIFTALRSHPKAGGDARLLPTLAEEVLDQDLSALYRRSLRLDAQLFNARHASPQGLAQADTQDTTRIGETGSALGRALRKLLLRVQATRFAARAADPDHPQKNEPPFVEARLVLVERVLDEAFALDASASSIDPALDSLSAKVEQSHRAFRERVAEENSVNDPRAMT